jgi:hypothetical protein
MSGSSARELHERFAAAMEAMDGEEGARLYAGLLDNPLPGLAPRDRERYREFAEMMLQGRALCEPDEAADFIRELRENTRRAARNWLNDVTFRTFINSAPELDDLAAETILDAVTDYEEFADMQAGMAEVLFQSLALDDSRRDAIQNAVARLPDRTREALGMDAARRRWRREEPEPDGSGL